MRAPILPLLCLLLSLAPHGTHAEWEYGEEMYKYQIIAGATWEYTDQWDCGGNDIWYTSRASWGSESAVEQRQYCAQQCLSYSNCVAFNYPDPGNGYCWIKYSYQLSTYLGTTCGSSSSSWDYYTLINPDAICSGETCVPGSFVNGDPHLFLPHGGKADFRGEDKSLYNFLSAKDLSLNVMTEVADFELHPQNHSRHKNVHGSFLTQAHVVARTNTGKMLRVSFWADMIGPKNIGWANGTIDDEPAFKLGPKMDKTVDNVHLEMDYSSLRVLTPEFEIIVTPIKFGEWPEHHVVGLHHRLDVNIKPRIAENMLKVAPHGIVGQGWDGDGMAIDGEQDEFPESGEFTTYAMAKGAIEGVPTDYKVAKPYITAFKFSRFDATSAAPRDVAALVAAGELNTPKTVPTAGDVGSTEHNFTAM